MLEKLEDIINTIKFKQNKSLIKGLSGIERLRDDLGLDSLDLAELTVRLEYEFGIDVFEDGLVETVNEILNKLERK